MIEQKEASHQVLEALRDVNDSTSEVQVTSKEMSSGIETVVLTKNNLDYFAQTVAESMDVISSGVSEINSSAQNVSSMATTTSDNIQIMKSIIDTFKLEQKKKIPVASTGMTNKSVIVALDATIFFLKHFF